MWATAAAIGGAFISSKGQPALSEPVVRGFIAGGVIGYMLGLILERYKGNR